MPLLLQPIVAPCITKESHIHLFERYSFKANIWIAIFSFIGNYWYTHYFYSVLKYAPFVSLPFLAPRSLSLFDLQCAAR